MSPARADSAAAAAAARRVARESAARKADAPTTRVVQQEIAREKTWKGRKVHNPRQFTAELMRNPPTVPPGAGVRPVNVLVPEELAAKLRAYCLRTGRSRREVVHALLLQILADDELEGTWRP